MALTTAQRKILRNALADKDAADAVADAIDAAANDVGAAVADLGLTITDPPTDVEVQAISDKVDELLASLRAAGIIST